MRAVTAITAAAIVFGGTAFAQITPPPAEPAMPEGGTFIAVQADTDLLLGDLVGHPLFDPAGEVLGTINGLLFDSEGQITGIIVGVGGFLGIGQKTVAVDFSALEMTVNEDGVVEWTLAATQQDFADAPVFEPLDAATAPVPVPEAPAPVTPAPPATPAPAPEPAPTPAPTPEPAPTPAPITPTPMTPAPVTPAPVTPAPVTPAPTPAPPATPTPGAAEPTPAAATPSAEVMAMGEDLYMDNCAICHGAEGQGTVGPALVGNPFLTSGTAVAFQILHGNLDHGMPAFAGQLTDVEIAAIATFVRNSWGAAFGPVDAATVAEQRAAGPE